MKKSGGNAKLVEFFSARGIDKSMKITTKYNTKQAAYYRDRLTRWLDGKTEPPPDPGRFDPATGVSEAQGAEPLPGETTDQYNARQARLREEARERLRQKFGGSGGGFGGGGMVGMGSPEPAQDTMSFGGILGRASSFVKEKVIDNQTVRGVAGGALDFAGNAINSAKQAVQEGEVLESLKMNARGEEGTVLASSFGAIGNAIKSVRGTSGDNTSSGSFGGTSKGLSEDDEAFFASIGQKRGGYDSTPATATNGNNNGKKGGWNDDDDWGGSVAPQPTPKEDPTKDMERLKKEMKMNLSPVEPTPAPAATPAAVPAQKPPTISSLSEPSPEKKTPAKLTDADDFFADFGL
jgi:hypothetical protein